MHWFHPELPGRRVRVAYCLNLHAAEDLGATLDGIRSITLPLRDRLASRGEPFGVGLYLPARLALALAAPDGEPALRRFAAFLRAESLDPFTFNAFPYGGFHSSGLKERVFEPTWTDPRRLAFTLAVARVARVLAEAAGHSPREGHLSISTHSGRFGPWEAGEEERGLAQLEEAARAFAAIEAAGGPRVVLSIEAEPRASAGDSRALAELHAKLRAGAARAAVERHVGTCLDSCHSAVEFEEPEEALALATRGGTALGKFQFSSALALERPAERPQARALLLGMAEERYLHQVTGRRGAARARVADLPELAAALEREAVPWLACEEWRCHFHVPVDLAGVGAEIGTTRAHAERLLELALARPSSWGSADLHVEIETYTWDVLPRAARGEGELVDGLEREYRPVMSLLEACGWRRAGRA